ncbi:hypothetical protein HYPBUDRAFT_7079 [Hyphopichia burtonii NRRL Y-1933]|uniref:Rho-GAP domain-containing protein n=1 Tax=Hyphopichia burtonii NRRL Y-1933 TaxID=984485 RepID=A0A1E4RHE5_9ASCO|nr:hypothetical protein HYPBUDRAFT_7079 [Hyphopichia burtonii NRRL Y-1933]ODV66693.1 hypothetical protein HYPBUDRAFT_7079 [Hyphopichia burtonii NRRL Y-1933]
MRKIWSLRKDKDKRKSMSGASISYQTSSPSPLSHSSHNHPANHKPSITSIDSAPEFDPNGSIISYDTSDYPNNTYDDYPTLANSTISSIPEATTLNSHNNLNFNNYHLNSNHNHSLSSTSQLNKSYLSTSPTSTTHDLNYNNSISKKTVSSLIKPDYDTKLIKHNWLNVIVNSHSVNEISEQTLKVCRAELKGSHLYLYKPSPTLNIKSFRIDGHQQQQQQQSILNDEPVNQQVTAPPQVASSPSINAPATPANNQQLSFSSDLFKNSNGSNLTLQELTAPSTPQINHPAIHTPPPPVSINDDIIITYFQTTIPHPDLKFEETPDSFKLLLSLILLQTTVPSRSNSTTSNSMSTPTPPTTGGSSLESIIHFFLFAPGDPSKYTSSINQLIQTLPLFPNFGKILKLIHLFLFYLLDIDAPTSKFINQSFDISLLTNRLIQLFKNIDSNFSGFLLKSDIAPYILKILETLTDHCSTKDDLATLIQTFKSTMLLKQQLLINLVNHDSLSGSDNPLQDLNSTIFMNDINLFDMATAISTIDLNFFEKWNSNFDKSLLLTSSLNNSSNGVGGDFFYKKNPLIFNNDNHIHYLSKLLINHLFIENVNANGSSHSLEKKARLLEKWIDLGCLLDKSGNMSSWLGISSIILSQPVLRLTKIWALVSPDYIKLLKNDWSPVLFELDRRHLANGGTSIVDEGISRNKKHDGSSPSDSPIEKLEDFISKDSYHIMAPRGLGKIYPKEKVIPFFGDLVINNSSSTNINDLESIWKRVNYLFSRWNEYLSNLKNFGKIIKYNEDVLKRYDNMGFIFSNESLNQVLYLGANSNSSNLEDIPPNAFEDMDNSNNSPKKNSKVNQNLQSKLLRLIEINCESTSLEKIMKLSLTLEPELPEAYLKVPPISNTSLRHPSNASYTIPEVKTPLPSTLTFKLNNSSSSNLSIHSNDSSNSINTTATDATNSTNYQSSNSNSNSNNYSHSRSHTHSFSTGSVGLPSTSSSKSIDENNPASKIPIFNNHYFKLNLSKYDDLTVLANGSTNVSNSITHDPRLQFHHTDGPIDKHNVVIDDDLTFRIDDFVSDLDNSLVTAGTSNTYDDVGDNEDADGDVPGLGIDVDDILNSDKFNNFSISATNSPNPNENKQLGNANNNGNTSNEEKAKNHASFGAISSDSSHLRNSHGQSFKYIPKYASIDKLIDLLLIDSKYFDELISLDLTEYRFVFLLNYNSFISTRVLLDKLAHRFINSGNAVISVMKKLYMMRSGSFDNNFGEFPNWNIDTSIDLNELGDVDYELLLKIQINILKILIVLINNFYSNFATDLTNKKILIKLLKLYSNEILQWYNSNKIDASLEKSFESLVNYYKKLKKLFVKKTYRPVEILKFDEYLINEFKFNNSLHEVPMNRNLPGHKNINKIEKFLHKFNKLLTVFYKGIKAEDWIKIYKTIENQYENHSLLDFNLQRNSSNDDNLMISNVFTFFESLTDPLEKRLLLKKFPLVFRKLFKLYYKFRSYLLIQLSDLNITVEERLDRMKTLLIMTKISKLKMSDNQFVFEGDRDNIPSCIESAITNVIYSPESRSFTNLWIKASNALINYPDLNSNVGNGSNQNSFNDLNSLLPPNIKYSDLIMNHEPLLPCFGWIIENLIETNKCPSFHHTVINFNKRYLIYKLIKELSVEDIDSGDEVSYHDTREFEFLLKLDESLATNQHLRDFSNLEKDKVKLFRLVLRDQHKILMIDNKKKQVKENKDLNSSNSNGIGLSSSNPNNNSLNKKTSTSSLRRQSLSYKSNSSSRFKISGLFNKTRPFSLNVSGLSNQSDRVVSAKELPNIENHQDFKQKPFLVIPLKNKKVFPVYLLPLCFKIDSETSNDDYFFQAPNEIDLNDWLVKLNYANRHWFYSRLINLKSNHNYTTFGIPINVLCNREQSSSPRVLDLIFEEIENEGLKDIGVYRISSSISELNHLKTTIDKTGTVNFNDKAYDVHTLTSCVKSYFRELPDALLTDKVIDAFFSSKEDTKSSQEDNELKLVENYRDILKNLPTINYFTLKHLLRHLQKISQYSNENKMTASNLATVIGPALTEASSLESLVNNFGFMNSILEKLIVHYEYVFEDTANDASTTYAASILDTHTINEKFKDTVSIQ